MPVSSTILSVKSLPGDQIAVAGVRGTTVLQLSSGLLGL